MCSFSPASWKNKKFRKGIFRCISKRNKLTGEREGSRNLIFLFFLPWEKTSRVIPSSSSSAALSLVYLSISLLVLLCLSFLIFGTHGLTWLFAHMTRLWATRWWGFKLTTFRRLTSPLRNWRDFNGASIWISRRIGEGSTTHIPPIKSISPSKCYFNQIGFQFLIPTVLYSNGKAGRPGEKKKNQGKWPWKYLLYIEIRIRVKRFTRRYATNQKNKNKKSTWMFSNYSQVKEERQQQSNQLLQHTIKGALPRVHTCVNTYEKRKAIAERDGSRWVKLHLKNKNSRKWVYNADREGKYIPGHSQFFHQKMKTRKNTSFEVEMWAVRY
jgi:hypothetical protein